MADNSLGLRKQVVSTNHNSLSPPLNAIETYSEGYENNKLVFYNFMRFALSVMRNPAFLFRLRVDLEPNIYIIPWIKTRTSPVSSRTGPSEEVIETRSMNSILTRPTWHSAITRTIDRNNATFVTICTRFPARFDRSVQPSQTFWVCFCP